MNVAKGERKGSELAAFVKRYGVSTKQSTTLRECIDSPDISWFHHHRQKSVGVWGPFHDIWRGWEGGRYANRHPSNPILGSRPTFTNYTIKSPSKEAIFEYNTSQTFLFGKASFYICVCWENCRGERVFLVVYSVYAAFGHWTLAVTSHLRAFRSV